MIECAQLAKAPASQMYGRTTWKMSRPAGEVLTLLLQMQFSCADRILYFIGEARDEDGLAACLELMEFGPDGECSGVHCFTGFGEEARLLNAFYHWFLPAREGQRLKVMVMLHSGITDSDDLRAGLRLKDVDSLMAAIKAAEQHGMGLHFFVHPK